VETEKNFCHDAEFNVVVIRYATCVKCVRNTGEP